MEMPLVAEGWRKLAMLYRLIATGSLLDEGAIFWDEPEANLNPKLIREVARAILGVCEAGVQAIIATHRLPSPIRWQRSSHCCCWTKNWSSRTVSWKSSRNERHP